MNFIFKIFGAPHVLDIYQGSEAEINYFQSFDAGSENAKLTIHRMASGQVSYSFLRYNILSGSGRTGAFFGMSVIFRDGEYCADIESLYELFETVYKTVLTNRILLAETENIPNVQAKFLVQKFADAESEVKRVESIISNNLRTNYEADIHSLDVSFKNAAGEVKRLNTEQGNAAFLAAMRESSWVSISPEYRQDEVGTLSPDAIAELKEAVRETGEKLTEISNCLLKGEPIPQYIKIAELGNDLKNSNKTIHKHLKVQPRELSILKAAIDSVIEQYNSVMTAVKNQSGDSAAGGGSVAAGAVVTDPVTANSDFYVDVNPNDSSGGSTAGGGIYAAGATVTVTAMANRGYRFMNWTREGYGAVSVAPVFQYTMPAEYVSLTANFEKKAGIGLQALAWSCGIAVVVVGLLVLKPENNGDNNNNNNNKQNQYNALIKFADSLVRVAPFKLENIDTAIARYKTANTISVSENKANEKITAAKQAAVDTLKSRAASEFEKGGKGNTKKIDGYDNAEKQLKKITEKQYGKEDDYKEILKDYRTKTIEYYEEKINDSKTTADDKQKYAGIITEKLGDTENAVATKTGKGKLKVTATDADHVALSNNTVKYSGTTATFRVNVENNTTGQWSSASSAVTITNPSNRDTEVKIEKPVKDLTYTLTFTEGNNSKSVNVKTQLQATNR